MSMFKLFPVGEKEDLEKLESSFLDGTFTPFPDHVEEGTGQLPRKKKKRGTPVDYIY